MVTMKLAGKNLILGIYSNIIGRCADTILTIRHFWQIAPEKFLLHAEESQNAQECNVARMNHPQSILGGHTNRVTHDNPPDLFFNSENKCRYFWYDNIIWDNKNVVENRDLDNA